MNNRVCTKTAFCLFFCVRYFFNRSHDAVIAGATDNILHMFVCIFSSNPLSNNRVYSCHIFGEILLYVMFVKMFCSKNFKRYNASK